MAGMPGISDGSINAQIVAGSVSEARLLRSASTPRSGW